MFYLLYSIRHNTRNLKCTVKHNLTPSIELCSGLVFQNDSVDVFMNLQTIVPFIEFVLKQ